MTPAARWALAGAVAGALAGATAFAPARWAAWALLQATEGRVVLGDAQGSLWAGQARLSLTGGTGSRDAMTLPGLLHWRLGWDTTSARVTLRHTEVAPQSVVLRWWPALSGWTLALAAGASAPGSALMEWPAAWLAALGTPWNTVQPSGHLRLSSPGFSLTRVQGRTQLEGSVVLEAMDMASRLSTLPRLGSYRVDITSGGSTAEWALLRLTTLDGALLLSGTGQWVGSRFRLRGEARAAPGQEAALQNLLNLVGRRDGARSVLSIG